MSGSSSQGGAAASCWRPPATVASHQRLLVESAARRHLLRRHHLKRVEGEQGYVTFVRPKTAADAAPGTEGKGDAGKEAV